MTDTDRQARPTAPCSRVDGTRGGRQVRLPEPQSARLLPNLADGEAFRCSDWSGDQVTVSEVGNGDVQVVLRESPSDQTVSVHLNRVQVERLADTLDMWLAETQPELDGAGTCDTGACCNSDDGDAASYAWPMVGMLPEVPESSYVPDAEPLAEWERELLQAGETVSQDTILDEAKAAVYGDRGNDYGHPREDFTRTAILWTGLLHHLLEDGEHITPEDVARCMVGVKLARDVHSPKRDNRVDMAGYALCLDRLETGL